MAIFLQRCSKESKAFDNVDIDLINELLELDIRLGTTATEHLLNFVQFFPSVDITEV